MNSKKKTVVTPEDTKPKKGTVKVDRPQPGSSIKGAMRTQAKDALKASEIRYRRLFESAQDGILILDARTGMIEDVNPFLIKMLGYSHEEFIKKKLWEVGAFKDIEASKEAFEALQDKEYIRYEDLPLKTKDGRMIQVEFISNVYLVGDEKVIQCNIRDITEHKRIIAAMQENEKKYRTLVTQNPDGIFLVDLSGNFLSVNQTMCEALGFSEEELISMKIWDIVPDEYLDQYKTRLTKILLGETLIEPSEYVVRGKDGKTRFIDVISAPYYSEKGIVGFQGIARDITERKRAEEALTTRETQLSTIYDNIFDVLFTIGIEPNDQFRFTSVNHRFAEVTGFPEDQVVGKLVREVIPEPAYALVFGKYQEAIRNRQPAHWEEVSVYPAGTRVGDVTVAPIFDVHGNCWQLIGTVHDITERKRADEALQASQLIIEGIINAIPMMVFWKDKNLVYRGCNAAYARDKGLADPKDVVGKDDYQMARRDLAELYRSDDLAVIESGFPKLHAEEPSTDPEGNPCTLLTSKVPLRNSKGEVTGILGTYMDITERKQMEIKLEEERILLRTLIDNLPDRVFVKDVQGRKSMSNLADWQACGGKKMEDVIGKTDFDTYPPEMAADYWALDKSVIDTGISIINHEESGFDSQGNQAWILTSKVPLRDGQGRVAGLVGIGHDITERKRAESQLNEQLAELQRWNAAMLGREQRVQELKREVNEFLAQAGQPPRYPSVEGGNP